MIMFWNKHKYIRLVQYNSDKSININYIKRSNFNLDQSLLINPDHVFNFKGYTTIVKTSESAESMNPLNFQSKYDVKKFNSAISSKLISETFSSLKKPKFDLLMASVMLNALTLVVVIYLFMKVGGML